MQTATAYYDGSQIVINDDVRNKLTSGQIITISFDSDNTEEKKRAERRRKFLASKKAVVPSGRSASEIDGYIREMRDHDRQ